MAAGKGVVVAADTEEATAAVRECLVDKKFGKAGEIVIVEELLDGPEVSVSHHSVEVQRGQLITKVYYKACYGRVGKVN